MRRLALMSLLIIGLVFSSVGAHAALFNTPGDALVLDSNKGKYWIQDLSAFTSGTYDEQQFSISVLKQVSYSGISTWHMATLSDMQDLWTYDADVLAAIFSATYAYNIPSKYGDTMWYGRYNSMVSGVPGHYYAGIDYDDSQGTYSLSPLESWALSDSSALVPWGAWVVSDPVAAIPLPPSLLLLLSGLVTCAGFRKWFKR